MQKEALCISYPQFIGAETLKKEGQTYHSMYFVPKIANRQTLSIEVSYANAKGGFMHFVPTKKEVYVICTQKSRNVLRSQDYLRTYMYFVPNFKNVETLSLPLNYNITI